jgi:hypothetical protein
MVNKPEWSNFNTSPGGGLGLGRAGKKAAEKTFPPPRRRKPETTLHRETSFQKKPVLLMVPRT